MHDQPTDQNAPLPPNLPTDRRALLAGIGGLAAGALFAGKANAGPLTPPPGPIAPTPGPEPRIPIGPGTTPGDGTTTFRISQPGSYYLQANVQGESAAKMGITIAANNVTLDLNGFALIGTGGTGTARGIVTSGERSNITIRNGTITNWSGSGIDLISGSTSSNSLIEGVIASDNGFRGIQTSNRQSVVRACVARRNTSTGIAVGTAGVVTGCAAEENGFAGITTGPGSLVTECVARANANDGIFVGDSSVVQNCTCSSNGADGIEASSRSSVSGSNTHANSVHGIRVSSDSSVTGNLCCQNGITGISAASGNRIEDNHCRDNLQFGIRCLGSRNFIVRNTSNQQSGLNYVFEAGNRYGPVVDLRSGSTPLVGGSTSIDATETTHPWANFAL